MSEWRLVLDRSGAPLVELPELGLAVSLLPVTKAHFETFLAQPDGYGDAWYEELLAVNPRQSWRHFTDPERERLLLSGIRPAETAGFLRWLNPAARLPTVDEWRAMDRALTAVPFDAAAARRLREGGAAPWAMALLRAVHAQDRPTSLAGLGLTRGGLLEWVLEPGLVPRYGGLGQPRHSFFRNVLEPQSDAPVEPFASDRPYCFGFRYVQSLGGDADPVEGVL